MNLNQLIEKDFTLINKENLSAYKRRWAKGLSKNPKNSEIISAYRKLLKQGKIKKSVIFEGILKLKSVRSLSGVTPLAVMTKPFSCPGRCIYCPVDLNLPKSYLRDEPAAQRALKANFDPRKQIMNRLQQLWEIGHATEKIELIVIGGTFSVYPKDYKTEFFKMMFEACNGRISKTLEEAQKKNETAKQRVVGISVETRPDWVSEDEVRLLRKLGVTKIQLGVQAFDETILKKIKRGHLLKPVAEATRLLKNAGFKICYHLMPNLPGSNPQKDVEMAKIMYGDTRFKPDYLKIYPTQVIPGTELHKLWKAGKFLTYDDSTLKEVLKKIKLLTPRWVRIDRLVRDISSGWVAGGTRKSNLRQIIQKELSRENLKCQCIRCREIKKIDYQEKPRLFTEEYQTEGGQEIFLSFERKGNLYSLLRLRLPERKQKPLFSELRGAALVRDIHTFGPAVPLDAKESDKAQHQGLGKQLLRQAEKIAGEKGYRKIAVIAAIGTREYYRKIGYRLEGLYLTKELA